MRVNIYAEELSRDVQVVNKTKGGCVFWGARLMLASARELQTGADDRSAITFWFTNEAMRDRFADALAGVLHGWGRLTDPKEV